MLVVAAPRVNVGNPAFGFQLAREQAIDAESDASACPVLRPHGRPPPTSLPLARRSPPLLRYQVLSPRFPDASSPSWCVRDPARRAPGDEEGPTTASSAVAPGDGSLAQWTFAMLGEQADSKSTEPHAQSTGLIATKDNLNSDRCRLRRAPRPRARFPPYAGASTTLSRGQLAPFRGLPFARTMPFVTTRAMAGIEPAGQLRLPSRAHGRLLEAEAVYVCLG